METSKVWFITGASKGLGLTLAKRLLKEGYRVSVTTRNTQNIVAQIDNSLSSFITHEVDLADNESVKIAIEKTIAQFGRIDVVVNNAGYGQTGTLEELTNEEARANFDINVFGTLNIIRNVMPHLRNRRAGHIFNISSVGGLFGSFAGWGVYCSSKFAVAGLTEALAEECKEFGIKATVVYPGYFRTDFLSGDSIKTPLLPIGAYEAARQSEQTHLKSIHENQPNDPEKAAEVMIEISKHENPPVHLLLGEDAAGMLKNKIEIITKEAAQWEKYTLSTSY